jgi:hypothetical protein
MWLEAIITKEDLVDALGRFLPVKIFLEKEGEETREDRWLLLRSATNVALIQDQGLRVTCPAEISWSIAGMSPTMKLDELRVMIRPQVVDRHGRHVLEFQFEVEEADFRVLPGFIDGAIAKAINGSLATKNISWNFTETLTRRVALGTTFEQIEALELEVAWGKHRIGEDALALVVSFKLDFLRKD